MKNFDKGTVVRTVLLFIALVNQTLIMFGKAVLPISEDQVNTLADALYVAGSTIFTIVGDSFISKQSINFFPECCQLA
ncbi:phage holin [Bacillus haynesii]|uniref:phage holin n=1 Tax=Bacillus haynesii TaxID=1925021 RepID=UPI002DDCC3F7|nr:phage holin [Bacillus haynesii]